jgi:serine/threonine protein kinase
VAIQAVVRYVRVVNLRHSPGFPHEDAPASTGANPTALRILHVTDLHQGLARQSHLWPSVRDEFFADLKRISTFSEPWHALLFTGDLTQSGRKEEFHKLDEVLDEILDELGNLGSEPLLLAVPGNHDLERPSKKSGNDQYVLNSLLRWGSTPENDELLWSSENSQARELLFQAFQNYTDWSKRWQERQKGRFEVYHPGILPGDFAASVRFGDFSISFVGLNSSFLQLDGSDYQGKLVLAPQQIHHACPGSDAVRWVKRHSLCFLMSHHGPEWLSSASLRAYESDIYPPERFVAHLHGHTHANTQRSEERDGTQQRRVWQASSLFGLENWGENETRAHGYTALRFDLSGPGKCTFRRWPRCASRPGGAWHFHVDTNIRLDTDGGTFVAEAPLGRADRCASATVTKQSEPPREDPITAPQPGAAGAARRLGKQAHGGEQLSLLDVRLSTANQRLDNLARGNLPTKDVEEEILALKRSKRDGVPLESGDILPAKASSYLLCERLGQGGFGTVWKAKDIATDHFVAIKVLHGQYAHDRTKIERFSRGARVLGLLAHPNIVSLIEPYQEVNGYHFFVMMLIEGPTLDKLVDSDNFSATRIPDIARQICDAVAHAHQHGYIHRDIKPSNIIFDGDAPCLTDFDLVMGNETSGGTRAYNPMGSLGFSAPEQFDAPDRVTAAADVCSIARCLVFMYLGENLPIEILSAPEKVVRRIASTDAVRDVLKKGCHAKLKVRYKSVREFWDAYEEALTAREPEGGANVIMMVLPQCSISMVGLPEGRFLMGTPDETGDELPHFVRLSAFGLSETTVTEGQWNAVMDGHAGPRHFTGDPRMPIVCVSWFNTIDFLNRLSEMQGLQPCYRRVDGVMIWDHRANGFRLPTEAEWEYAARAGTDMDYSFGNTARRLKDYGWCGKHAKGHVHPVKLLKPNPWHLYDMHGNIREWVWDFFGKYPVDETENPSGPAVGNNRVVRGGSHEVLPHFLRSADRGAKSPASDSDTVGFRIAVNAPAK